jgi:hypothetical protein
MKHRLINTMRSLTLRSTALTARRVCPSAARTAANSPKEVSTPMPALSGEAAVRHLEQAGLRDSLSAALAAALYKVEERKGLGYEASNPKQNFRIVFITEGVEVRGASPAGLGWRLGMRLAAYGYGERKMPVTVSGLKAEGDRVEYELRSSDGAGLSEWYVNRADGLEHGFIMQRVPGKRLDGEKLSLWVSLSGDLEARLAEEGSAILLDGREAGVRPRYDSLHAYDATGRELPARMMLSGGGVKLEVSDEDAVYPVTIDPKLWIKLSYGSLNLEVSEEDEAHPAHIAPRLSRRKTRLTAGDAAASDFFGRSARETKLTAGDAAAGDYFGCSVAISGDTAVVGAHRADGGGKQNQGAAYVFTRSEGTWTERQKLTASDGATFDEFGISVAIDGDTIVVGAREADVGGSQNQGAAYVFTRSGTTWTEQKKLTALDGEVSEGFGRSVAISGGTVVVGGRAAYVFTPSGTQQKLTKPGSGNFGWSVAIGGDTIVVGAYSTSVGGSQNQGAAYVFVRSGETWIERQQLTASDGAAYDHFGSSVAISGDTIVIGAQGADVGGKQNQGAAYVFTWGGGSWTERQKFTASDGAARDSFGSSVAISGDTVVVGAMYVYIGANYYQGAAYAFARSGATWTEQGKLIAWDGAANDRFGSSVAIDGGTVVVGASYQNFGDNTSQGAVYVFARPTVNPTDPNLPDGTVNLAYNHTFTASGGTAPYAFAHIAGSLPQGLTLAANGNLSGTPTAEGESTFTVEATDDNSVTGQREYTLVINRITVNPTNPNLPVGAVDFAYNQTFTATGGIAPFTFAVSAGALPAGLTLATGGTLSGMPTADGEFAFTIQVKDADGFFGQREYTLLIKQSLIVNPTDPNLPVGTVDLAYNQKFTATGGTDPYTFAVSAGALPAGLTLDPDGNLSGTPTAEGEFTFTVQARDSKGDSGQRAYALATQRPLQEAKLMADDGRIRDNFGLSVAIEGDLVVVGAPSAGIQRGAVYVFERSGTNWIKQAQLIAGDATLGDRLGYSFAIEGDTIVAGAPYDDVGAIETGSVYVFVRRGTEWAQEIRLNASDVANHRLGISVAFTGDTIVAGAPTGNPDGRPGSAYVFVRALSGWSQQAKLIGQSNSGDLFGQSVAIEGDTIVVGAPYDDAAAYNSGAVYVFTRSETNWIQQAQLIAGDAAFGDRLGYSVAISGDTIVAGALGPSNSGWVYIFVRSETGWSEQAKLTASEAAPHDLFGYSVAISSDTVAIGAAGNYGAAAREGSTYVFKRSGTSWSLRRRLTASDAVEGASLGWSVAVSGGTVVAGAPGADAADANAGAAYVFEPTSTSTPPKS